MALKYILVRTKSDQTDDPDPNTTAPADAAVWSNVNGGNDGFRAVLEFASGHTCSVTAWARDLDPAASPRFTQVSETLTGVVRRREISAFDTGGHDIYLQITARSDNSSMAIRMVEAGDV